jgi:hypothetical protein
MIKIGSKWHSTSTDYALFEVRDVEQRSDGVWVSYGRYGEDRTFSCLVDAFLERFREHIN